MEDVEDTSRSSPLCSKCTVRPTWNSKPRRIHMQNMYMPN